MVVDGGLGKTQRVRVMKNPWRRAKVQIECVPLK
ncbi:hypothetical protein A2U01_0052857, partial [Trifolium medium]|nr:hypothetical protein [Trifolium medium]